MAKVKVTRNYQITLPREVRVKLGIEEGGYVEIVAVDETRAVVKRLIPIERLAGAWDGEMDVVMEEAEKLWKAWLKKGWEARLVLPSGKIVMEGIWEDS